LRPLNASVSIRYPLAGSVVSGLQVLDDIPNTASISASFYNDEYQVLKGIREVPLRDFVSDPKKLFYAANDLYWSETLALEIANSESIKPLIVVAGEKEGPYILEGGHRLAALHILKKSTFPALVVDVSQEQAKEAMELNSSENKPCKLKYLGQDKSGFKFYFLNILDDSFVHFTTNKRAKEIISSKKLLLDSPYEKMGAYGVFAVSLTYGKFVRGVAFDHVKKTSKIEDEEIVAVEFKTNTVPNQANYVEETSWDTQDVTLINPKIISSTEAIEKLNNSPCKLKDREVVIYDTSILNGTNLINDSTSREASGYTPPSSVANQAKKGLEYRRKAKGKGGLNVQQAKAEGIGSGVQRAVNLKTEMSYPRLQLKE